MNSLKSVALNILIPLLISFLLALIVFNEARVPKIIFSLVPYIFYAVSILILWVSWHFNRTKFIFIIIPLILMHIGFEYLSAKNATNLFMYSSIVFPLHLLVFLLLKERGIFFYMGNVKGGIFCI